MTKGKARTTTRRSLVLSAELALRVQAEQARTGAPVAEIIRRALDAYLTPREQAARKAGAR
jgi:predicted DNA-binding protein